MEEPADVPPAAFRARGGTKERAYDSASSVDALEGLLLPQGWGLRCGTPPKPPPPPPPPPEGAPSGTRKGLSPPHTAAGTAEIPVAAKDAAEASAAPCRLQADRSCSAPAESVACPGVPADLPSDSPTSAAAWSPAGLVAAAGWTPPSPAAITTSFPTASSASKPPTASLPLSQSSSPAGRLPFSCPWGPSPASLVCPDSSTGGGGSCSSSGLHYAAVFLTAVAQRKLLEYAPPQHAKVFADHVTLLYRPSVEQVQNNSHTIPPSLGGQEA